MTRLVLRNSSSFFERAPAACFGADTRHGTVWLGVLVLFLGLATASKRGASSHEPCTIRLERLSYDDPGTDDEEWLALSALNRGSAETFSDCGVASLSLVDADMTCSVNRYFDLAALAIPADDQFVICAQSSAIGQSWGCDLTSDSTAALTDGWLQNGPEMLRLTATDGEERWSFAYGSGSSCPAATELPNDQGSIDVDGTKTDDVLARCDERYVRLPIASAAPRELAVCPSASDAPTFSGSQPNATSSASSSNAAPTTTGSGAASNGVDPNALVGTVSAGAPSATPSTTPTFTTGHVRDAGVRLLSSAELVEAGTGGTPAHSDDERTKAPSLPDVGCAFRGAAQRRHGTALVLLGAWLMVAVVRRRLERRALLRARCDGRCARSSRRLP